MLNGKAHGMDNDIERDLLAAHADALRAGDALAMGRYDALFPDEMAALEPLFALAARLHALLAGRTPMRAEFRADLKAGLLAEAHQQRLAPNRYGWRWAALGASAVTVAAGVIAAAAWRGAQAHR